MSREQVFPSFTAGQLSVTAAVIGGFCANCHAPPVEGQKLKRCGNCRNAYYCSKKCQKQHRAAHKPICDLGDPIENISQKNAVHPLVKQATRMFLSQEPRAPVEGEDWVRQVIVVEDRASLERLQNRVAMGLSLDVAPAFVQIIPAKPIEGECQRLDCHEAGIRKCLGCEKVYYCSAKCQKKDWRPVHKHVCKPPADEEEDGLDA